MSDEPVRVDLAYRLRLGEIAEAAGALSRTARPVGYWLRWILVAAALFFALLLSVLVAWLRTEGTRGATDSLATLVPCLCVYLFVVSPWSSSWVVALAAGYDLRGDRGAQVLESFSRQTIRARTGTARGAFAPGAMPYRLETKRTFVFGREGGMLGPVFPKRMFPDAATIEAFRDRTMLRPSSVETSYAVAALGETEPDDGITFTVTVAEHLRARWWVVRTSAPLVAGVLLLVACLALGAMLWQVVRESFGVGVVSLLFYGVFYGFIGHRVRTRVAASLRPTTLRLDDVGIGLSTPVGRVETTWAAAAGYVEDATMMLVFVRSGLALILPKRAVPESVLATVRARSKSYRG